MAYRKFAKLPRAKDQFCPICHRKLVLTTKISIFLRSNNHSMTLEKIVDLPYCKQCKLPYCDDNTLSQILEAYPEYTFRLIDVEKNISSTTIINECELKGVNHSEPLHVSDNKNVRASSKVAPAKERSDNTTNASKNKNPLSTIPSDEFAKEGRNEDTLRLIDGGKNTSSTTNTNECELKGVNHSEPLHVSDNKDVRAQSEPTLAKERSDSIADIFKNKNPLSAIPFDEFAKNGWNEDTFLQYLQRCETVRAVLITTQTDSDLDSFFVKNIRKDRARNIGHDRIKEELVELALNKLLLFLQLNSTFEFSDLDIPVKYLKERICYKLNTPDDQKTQIMFKYLDDFRRDLENAIRIFLREESFDAPLSYEKQIKQHKLTEGKMRTIIHELENELNTVDKTREDISSRHFKSPIALRNWARKSEEYVNMKKKEHDLEVLKKQIKDNPNNTPKFEQARDTLYIYSSNSILCFRDKHELIDVTCIIKLDTSKGRTAAVNAKYCPKCRKFLISNTSYEQYMKTYTFLPVIFKDYDASATENGWGVSLQKTSPLSRMGYSVEASKNYSTSKRHNLLRIIIDMRVMSKQDVIKYLEQFIKFNGLRANMDKAVSKWEDDLNFVNNYNIDQQATTTVHSVEKYQK